ncbi:MAG: hypothetical protein ABS949_15910 [Solibacillus sp.]
MSSAETLQQIMQHLAETEELITIYREQVQEEIVELSELDKYDQDALHLLEQLSMNAAESAKLFKAWHNSRTRRRVIKRNLQTSNEVQPVLIDIQQKITKIKLPTMRTKYTTRTQKMTDFVEPFYEKGRLDQANFSPFVEKNVPEKIVQQRAPFTHDVFEEPVEVVFEKKTWQLKLEDELLYQNKKLLKVVEEVIDKKYPVTIEQKHYKVFHSLINQKDSAYPVRLKESI